MIQSIGSKTGVLGSWSQRGPFIWYCMDTLLIGVDSSCAKNWSEKQSMWALTLYAHEKENTRNENVLLFVTEGTTRKWWIFYWIDSSDHDTCTRNIAEQLIEKGLANIVRHKRDDEDRSPDYDKLMAADQMYAFVMLHLILLTMP